LSYVAHLWITFFHLEAKTNQVNTGKHILMKYEGGVSSTYGTYRKILRSANTFLKTSQIYRMLKYIFWYLMDDKYSLASSFILGNTQYFLGWCTDHCTRTFDGSNNNLSQTWNIIIVNIHLTQRLTSYILHSVAYFSD
jgi:hypothetical protein